MDQIIPDLLKLGPPGIIILVLLWVVRFLFNKYEERGQQLLDLSKVSQEDSRRALGLVAELTPVLRDQAALSENVRQLLQEFRSGRRR